MDISDNVVVVATTQERICFKSQAPVLIEVAAMIRVCITVDLKDYRCRNNDNWTVTHIDVNQSML